MTPTNHLWPSLPPSASSNLQPRALCEALAERIRERILQHELAPGSEIDESRLLKEYGVSRTPVREALKLLHHEGLLTGRPRRGMFVTLLEPEEVEEAFGLHRLLCAQQAKAPAVPHPPAASLLHRMVAMAEQQLRLAYGPGFHPDALPEGMSSNAGWRASSQKART